MTQVGESVSEFQLLARSVDDGALRLEVGVAERCVAACEEFINELDELKRFAQSLSTRSAYGTLGSAQALAAKFERKAIGDGGFEAVIQQHIDTVKQMQDVFDRAGKAYASAEESNARAVAAVGSGLSD
ncbi:hypothetical protein [Rhodococcus sp. NPDC058514]|uniref:hypothetical protein n=1 Tax=unclassified Rhodococcus (in: high G+C Gram-positive bacteria) TaxID=192944 RepID=UPI003668E2A3